MCKNALFLTILCNFYKNNENFTVNKMKFKTTCEKNFMCEFVKVNVNGKDHTVFLDRLPEILPEGQVYWFVCDEVEVRKDVTMVRYDGTLNYEDLKAVIMGYVEYNILALHATGVS